MIPIRIKQGSADLTLLLDYLDKKKDGNYWAKIEQFKNPRSLQQNKYYWLCLNFMAEHTGHSPEELHEIFKRLYLPAKFITYKGRDIKVPGSTTELSLSDFSMYMMRISAEAAELGVVLPVKE